MASCDVAPELPALGGVRLSKTTAGGLTGRQIYLTDDQWDRLAAMQQDPFGHPATTEARAHGRLRDNSASAIIRALVDYDTAALLRERDDWRRRAQALETARRRQVDSILALTRAAAEALAQIDPQAAQALVAQLAETVAAAN